MKPAIRRRIAEWEARGLAATVSSGVVGSSLVVGCGFTLPRSILVAKNALWAGVVRACTSAWSHCASRGKVSVSKIVGGEIGARSRRVHRWDAW